MSTTTSEATVRRGRRTAYIVVAVVLAVGIGVGTFAIFGLVVPWFVAGERAVHRVHDIGWGALGTLVLTAGLLTQVRPERAVGPLHAVLGALAGMLVAGLASATWFTAPIPIVVGGILLGLHPLRRAIVPESPRFSIVLAIVAVAAAVPLFLWALDEAAIQRGCPPTGDPHCDEFHWMSMAAIGFGLPLAALGAAMRAPGWRLAAWLVGLTAAVFGLASLVFPTLPSSVGRGWGAGAIIAGALFIALAEWERRRDRATDR
jgi:hypothetical protein